MNGFATKYGRQPLVVTALCVALLIVAGIQFCAALQAGDPQQAGKSLVMAGLAVLAQFCPLFMLGAVTANQVIKRAEGCRVVYPVAASTRIYEGTMVFIDASGYANDDTGSGANRFGGIAIAEVDNSGGSAGDLSVEVWEEGEFELVGSSLVQGSVGLDAYATDNFTIDDAYASNGVRVGRITRLISSTKVMVKLDPQTDRGGEVVGIGAQMKVVRGQHTTVAASDTVVTGLATVVAVVAQLDDDPVDGAMHVTASIGDQLGTPAAGSILIKTWKSTDADATLIAATTFTKKVNWIAIGT